MDAESQEYSYILTTNHSRNTHPQLQLFQSLCGISDDLKVVQFFPSKALKDEYCLKVPSKLEPKLLEAFGILNIGHAKSDPITKFFATNVLIHLSNLFVTKIQLAIGVAITGRMVSSHFPVFL